MACFLRHRVYTEDGYCEEDSASRIEQVRKVVLDKEKLSAGKLSLELKNSNYEVHSLGV